MATDYKREAGDQELIVFASTFEEAVCDFGDCMFKFLPQSDLPTITNVTVEYATIGNYRMIITGDGITDTSADTTQVYIGGKKQEVLLVGPYDGVEVLIVDIDSGLNP